MTKQSIISLKNGLPRRLSSARNNGFTLAEVLITLFIIGVIAAITVPTLITKYQKEQTVTRLKKAYSALAQTTNRAISDYGPMNTWEFNNTMTVENTKNFLNKYVVPYMQVSKKTSVFSEEGWSAKYYCLNGKQTSFDSTSVRFYLNDGTSITSYIPGSGNKNNSKRILFYIDINGDKKPNKLGKDIFQFDYFLINNDTKLSGKFIPDGIQYSRAQLMEDVTARCNKNREGGLCTALIMKDGWRISDDYPW